MIRNVAIFCLTFFSFYSSSQNFAASYGFDNVTTSSGTTDPGPSPTVNGLTFGSFFYSGAASNPNASGRFSFTGWPVGAPNGIDNYGNFTGVLSPTVYYEVRIGVSPGFTLDLNAISFAVRISGTGIRNYCVRSSLDGYNNNLSATTGTNSKLSVIPTDIFFWNFDSISTSGDQKGSTVSLGNAFSALTNSVAFRFYAWNSETAGGTFSIDNVTFTGSAADTLIIPDPAGIRETEVQEIKINLYPNPCREGTINISHTLSISGIEIINVLGSSVFQSNEWRPGTIRLNLADLPAGTYFVRLRSGNKILTEKLILCR